MTVAEFIEALMTFDPEAEIVIYEDCTLDKEAPVVAYNEFGEVEIS